MATFSRSAKLQWEGDTTAGEGVVSAASGAFTARATFPKSIGDPPGTTTPEELLAASHAVCFGIGLRSLIARRGGRARTLTVTATVTADKGPRGIVITSSHLSAHVTGLEGLGRRGERDDSTAVTGGFLPRNYIKGKALMIYWSYESDREDYVENGVGASIRRIFSVVTHFFMRTRRERLFRQIH